MKFFGLIVFGWMCVWPAVVAPQEIFTRNDLRSVFRAHGLVGTFAVLDVQSQKMILVEASRAHKRFVPASTFKIANSLIALELGVVADEDEIIPYGGAKQRVEAWEKDMSIRQAVVVSNVPVFQEIARRVGINRYQQELARLQYGNQLVGQEVESFWLQGPLKISAVEQVQFLSRLVGNKLPFSKNNQRIVRDILKLQRRGNAVLYGKTGWAVEANPDVGWFVGWVERKKQVFPFALNIEGLDRQRLKARVAITKELLTTLIGY